MCALIKCRCGSWSVLGAIAVVALAAGEGWAVVRVVPGTPSYVDLHIEGDVNINGVTAGAAYDHSISRLVGVNWPGESNPPVAGDWTLDDSMTVRDGDDYSTARSMVDFGYNYAGLTTDIRMRSLSTGITSSISLDDDDHFRAEGTIRGFIEMWLTSDSAADAAGPYDVVVNVRVTGSDLSASGVASAGMSFFTRQTPAAGGAAVDMSGAFTDLVPPPLNLFAPPTYLLEQSITYTDVPLAPGGQTLIAFVELGVGGPDGLRTNVEGRTDAPTLTMLSMADSLFDTTIDLQFRVVPEPSGLAVALGAVGLLTILRRRADPSTR
ncbi:MAG: hypothetical protein L0228_07130 [Planctomycetes bacterium]|nr:hypothetical protein [Planctomycetota bacterium]